MRTPGSPPCRRAADRGSVSPGRPRNSGLSFRRRSQTTKPSDGTVWVVAETVTTCSRDSSNSSPGLAGSSVQGNRPRSMPAQQPQNPLHRLDGRFGQVDHRRLHLHHPPPRHVDRQGDQVVHVGVRDEPRGRAHERPRLRPQIEADLQLRNPPIRLHRGPRIAFDGKVLVRERFDGEIVQAGMN